MDKTTETMIREFDYDENEDKPTTDPDNGLVLQLRGMLEKSLKENTKLDKKLGEQTLMYESIRTGIISLIKKVDNTIYPCEYNDALSDVIDLINKLELRKNEDEEQEENEE